MSNESMEGARAETCFGVAWQRLSTSMSELQDKLRAMTNERDEARTQGKVRHC
jgi:hypothetical protein